MRYLIYLALVLVCTSSGVGADESTETFRAIWPAAPSGLDPSKLDGTEVNSLFFNLYRGLFRTGKNGVLIKEGASRCKSKKLQLSCSLNPKIKWSDGSTVLAEDYVFAFRRLINPQNKSRDAGQILSLKNASRILKSELPPEKLGVTAANASTVVFDFEEEDVDFELKLASAALVPLKKVFVSADKSTWIFNGPYQVESWVENQKIKLNPQPHYLSLSQVQRPPVEIFFIEDESAALNLFESKKVNLLLRLPVSATLKYQKHPGFEYHATARFDYVGFGPDLKDKPLLRQALVESLNFPEFSKIAYAPEPLGCPGIPPTYFTKNFCLKFSPEHAKKIFKTSLKGQQAPPLVFGFSQMGGDYIRQIAEWYQGQWKRNLGLTVELKSQEQAVYTQTLQMNPPSVFRRGINLSRPSCLAALENFISKSPQNFIRLESQSYDQIIEKLKRAPLDSLSSRKLCDQGLEFLIKNYLLIPQGRIHFLSLSDLKFRGWEINELNQLDLSNLRL